MRGTKKYKIVKCFRHFGAIIILLWLISIVRFRILLINCKCYQIKILKAFQFYVNSC